jgi:hypothetical protein
VLGCLCDGYTHLAVLPANHAHKQTGREFCISDGISEGLRHRGIIQYAMVKAHNDAIAQLMREHVKREADDILLKSLLDRERSTGKVLHDWREELTRLQQCARYQEMIQEAETHIAEVLGAIESIRFLHFQL